MTSSRPFEDIKLEWGGKEYTIRSDRVMGVIMRVEEILTMQELHQMMGGEGRGLKFGKIASAYGTILRYAGAAVTDDEVYSGLFRAGDDAQNMAMAAITGLLATLIPPSAVVKPDDAKKKSARASKDEASSSVNSTRRPSALVD